jgi:transcriptional regulator with XRE-family HTH domain
LKKKEISQEALAEKLKITQSAYAKIEGGKRRIEAGLLKIAEELEEPIHAFLDQNGNMFHIENQNFHQNSAFNSAFVQHLYSEQKEIYNEQINLLREEIAEMRKERQELIALLRRKS